MFFLTRLALKNALRRPERTLFTTLAVAVAAATAIFASAFIEGMDQAVIRGQIHCDSGHIRLARAGFFETEDDGDLGPLLQVDSSFLDGLRHEAPDLLLQSRVSFPAHVSFGSDSLPVRAVGVEPAQYFAAFELPFEKGSWQDPAHPEAPIWLGAGLADAFGLALGDTVNLLVRTKDGSFNASAFTVGGIIRSRNAAIDETAVFLRRTDAAALLDIGSSVTEVVGFFGSEAEADPFAARIAPMLRGADVASQTWGEQAAPALSLNQVRRRVLSILAGLVLFVSGLGIVTTLTMACFERVRETATLRAIGCPAHTVARLFMIECGIVGALGAGLGAALGNLLLYSLRGGIDLTKLISQSGEAMSMASVLYLERSGAMTATVVAVCVMISLLLPALPAVRHARLSIAASIR